MTGTARRTRTRARAALLAVAALTTTAAATGASARPGHHAPYDREHRAGASVRLTHQLPGARVRTVTTVSGERYRLTRGRDGNAQVVSTWAPPVAGRRPAAPTQVQSLSSAAGRLLHLSAVPARAARLVADGKVDPALFDLLAVSRVSGSGGLPVTVSLRHPTGRAAAVETVRRLPGSRLVAGSVTPGRAVVRVDAGSPAFWDAVTAPGGGPRDRGTDRPLALAPGIKGLSLGHRPIPRVTPATTLPTYRLTVQLHASRDRDRWSSRVRPFSAVALGLSDLAGGQATIAPTGQACVDDDCTVMAVMFDVPAGRYSLTGNYDSWREDRAEWVHVSEPEVVVDHNSTLDLPSVDDASWVESATPRPSEMFNDSLTEAYQRDDGTRISNLVFFIGDRLLHGFYLLPSVTRSTRNGFHLMVHETLQEPRVQMHVDGAPGLALTPEYPSGINLARGDLDVAYLDHPLSGFRVVDAGFGRAEDLTAGKVKGRIALVQFDQRGHDGCSLDNVVQQRALDAGAVALLVDTSNLIPDAQQSDCGGAVRVQDWDHRGNVAEPTFSIPSQQAAQLRGLMARRAVFVDVTAPSHQQLSYLYQLTRSWVGGVPAHLPARVADDDLATRTSDYHGTGTFKLYWGGVAQQDIVTAGSGFTNHFQTAPTRITQYLGPESVDVLVNGSVSSGTRSATQGSHPLVLDDLAGRVRHLAAPLSVGPPTTDPSLGAYGRSTCQFCQAGDVLRPFVSLNSLQTPADAIGGIGLLPAAKLVDQSGSPVPLAVVGGLPGYRLTDVSQRYTYTSTQPSGDFSWTFQSRAPGAPNVAGTVCLADVSPTASCAPEPLVFVRYAAPVDLDNTLPAGTRQTISVEAYQYGGLGAAIRQARTDVSFDGGSTWKRPKAVKGAPGRYRIVVDIPRLGKTDGAVTLRTRANDSAGNSTDQTLVDAVDLS